MGVEARERQCWSLAGDEAHEGDPYALWSGVCYLGDGDQASGGSCGGLERGSRVAGGGHLQLRPKRSNFHVDVGFADMVRH